MNKTTPSPHWHALPLEHIAEELDTNTRLGLTPDAVARRQTQFGPNRLTERPPKSPLMTFLLQFHQPLVYILLAATAVTLALREWVDAGVIFGVVLVNAIIGYLQEHKAIKAIHALARSMQGEATVVRGGISQRIPSNDLVPGDLVALQSGDKVPADLRLIRCRDLRIDESALTGESLPVEKSGDVLSQQTVLPDRRNMAYSSTLVSYGTASGLVVETGDATQIGRINALIAAATELQTPLTRKLAQFSGVLLWIILGLAGLTVIVGLLRGQGLLDMFLAAVALAVGAIPEGLPAAMTITLAIGVGRMAKRHAIIRKLPAVETLGSTTVICSDKTGTLTENQMTVQEIHAGGQHYSLSGVGYAPAGEVRLAGSAINPEFHPALLECLKAGLLCNDSRLIASAKGWRMEGDPTEVALITAAGKAGMSTDAADHELLRHDTLPFESQHQYMATLHDAGPEVPGLIYMKGSVECVLRRCRDTLGADLEPESLDHQAVLSQVERMAAQGLRVLALARKLVPAEQRQLGHGDVAEGLSFLGLQAMMDPPRAAAVEAVAACASAGIQVKMITGDHITTATAIARQLGLLAPAEQNADPVAVNGETLSRLSAEELREQVEKVSVFARVAPEQKLRLVEALQANGHVVAMTGDGVNDAPALKQADIGVAMGLGGTEVAKEAADMVLTDDNFSTIVAAVEEGRAVYDNLVKFITWTLPTNVGEGLVILVAVMAGATLPITPVQILWINMTTAVLLGLMLAFERKEPGIMRRPPRPPKTPILTAELGFRIGLMGVLLLLGAFGLFQLQLSQGASLENARTVAVNMFVFGELFYLFNCRSLRYSMFRLGFFSNPWLLVGVAAMVLLQVLFTYSEVMQRLFGTAPLSVTEWVYIVGGGLLIHAVVGAEKWLRAGNQPPASSHTDSL
ncbi:MAG: HAD-IC family P-type ATPase [Chromatiales bacterium]|nr:HAD-IC family P-type ATPase [Chromatiales bacterium]